MLKNYIRYRRFKRKNSNVRFNGKSYFEFQELISFKNFAYIGPEAYWSAKGGITIGNNVIFGPKSILWTYSHNYKSKELLPYGKKNEDILSEIVIEDNVWIGLGVTILPGVTIGEGAVIGMKSVVTKNIPKYSVAVGNPARVIKTRDIKDYNRLLKENKLYLELK